MAKVLIKEFTGTIGGRVYDSRGLVKTKPEPKHLTGLKSMDEDELKRWAETHGTTLERAKKIQEKQKKLKEAVEECKKEQSEKPSEFSIKYPKRGTFVSSFNVCVGEKLRT